MTGKRVNLRFIDRIWHIRGNLPLAPGQSADEAFDRLEPLFRERNTSHDRSDGTLTFRKQDQDAQDKMSIFNSGVLQVEQSGEGPVLRYHLVSRALLYCFLAPLLFLAFGQLAVGLGALEKASPEAEEKAGKEKEEEKKIDLPQHPIDKFLGAPKPELPGQSKAEKRKATEGERVDKEEEKDRGPSPTPAYVFAGIFAVLYIVGRILEAWLIKSVFRKHLAGDHLSDPETALAQ